MDTRTEQKNSSCLVINTITRRYYYKITNKQLGRVVDAVKK